MIMDIPVDIWLYLSRFIEDEQLRDMISVNRVFYDIAMDLRWYQFAIRDAHIRTGRESLSSRVLRVHEPEVARRVRHFVVNLDDNGILSPLSWKDKLRLFIAPKDITFVTTTTLVATLPKLTNVREITIQSIQGTPSIEIKPLLNAMWMQFGPKLNRLYITGSLAMLDCSLSASSLDLPRLEEIELELMYDFFPSQQATDSDNIAILHNLVVPLINKSAPHLQSLKLTCWLSLDISTLMDSIKQLPVLRELHIRAPFDTAFASNPAGLTRVLATSPNLVDVSLRLNSASRQETGERLSTWLTDSLAHNILQNTRTLQIHAPAGNGFEALMAHLSRSGPGLTNLVVRDRYLSQEQLSSLLAALDERTTGHTVKALRFNLLTLQPKTFHQLQEHLPSLHRLSMYIGNIGSNSYEEFVDAVSQQSYPNWRLYDMGIWRGGTELRFEVMDGIARCVPSIRSFWGSNRRE